MTPFYLRVALPIPLRRLFDYLPPREVIDSTNIIPGVRVQVPFQSRTLVGILTDIIFEPSVSKKKLKRAISILDQTPLFTPDVYELCQWAADYYHHALGEVLMGALPALLRKGKPASSKKKLNLTANQDSPPRLNSEQDHTVSVLSASLSQFKVFLLDGVTGSGKTEVYLRTIDKCLQEDRQVLVLVPEISLTPQTIDRFQRRFSHPVVAHHSGLTDAKRLQAWLAARSGEAKIVIGTRSSIFTPFARLGLIIVDEEHDLSFKQQERFRYHARDLAIMRAHINRIPIILGSATPSLESILNVKRKRYHYLSLPNRAGIAQLPQYQLIDLRQTRCEEGLSPALLASMKTHLEQNNQVLLFLNRRGFAPVLYCTACHFIVGCKRCDTRMVYHHHPLCLKCHYCDAKYAIPTVCVQCGKPTLQPIGLGTQRLEQVLGKHFPDVPVFRIDRDSTRKKESLEHLLAQIHQTKKAILLGTQMLAKGHHFSDVTLVGIVDADNGLFSTDFRAAEQIGQLLVQVSGRAGRADKLGTVMVQTKYPDHVLLQTLIHQGYAYFSDMLLEEREKAVLPPFSHFAILRAESYVEKKANQFLTNIKKLSDKSVTLLGPVPALMAKRKGLYCQQLLMKSSHRHVLHKFLRYLLVEIEKHTDNRSVKWMLDVDPVEV